MLNRKFPFYAQHDSNDCGPACLKMVAKYYGKDVELEMLRQSSYINRNGVSLLGISQAAERIGFRTLMVQTSYEKLYGNVPLPCILHWNQEHFVVLFKKEGAGIGEGGWLLQKKAGKNGHGENVSFWIGDPAHDLIKIDKSTLLKSWISDTRDKGVALVLYPSPEFLDERAVTGVKKYTGLGLLFDYVKPYRRYIFQLFLGMILGSVISLALPFLTQTIVDYGVGFKDLSIVVLVLFSQLFLFAGSTVIELFRGWILLHMNSRISITILSDFLAKLMRLPVKFFDTHTTGDITQRLQDHGKIELFLTGVTINTFFSVVNIFVFLIILFVYSAKIFLTFFLFSTLSILWILFFLEKRKHVEYRRFQALRDNQDSTYEIVNGMKEIKLYNSEISRRWIWERIQVKLFKLNITGLRLSQYQESGFNTLTQLKNILVSFFAAQATINGEMTLGMMLSISYIIGQTNSPLQQLAMFFRSAQDAKLSMDRLQEIHNKENEDENQAGQQMEGEMREDITGDIVISNLSFKYGGAHSSYVLKDINLVIPEGKVTAIVGTSGSGKTTLLKLMLKFYEPAEGTIRVGNHDLAHLSSGEWREHCGAVMQDGYIFGDTIARNIVIDGSRIDARRMDNAVEIANIKEFIMSKPMKYTTRLGSSGGGLSAGQKQRILIARAVYKDPKFLLFDEATSALDANNERAIIENLTKFFQSKTVVVIAHRLSTVKNADQIVVLDQGEIAEQGTHAELVQRKGKYFDLVKNQLELGN
ncbi:peptidase domain-containing ABC transporter [Chitinophaga varians]|uniref:Peptidase domain-containing ABC transporter n=1 Tax=Chitinophaga varians TaxID=2202339 RepID=A0A847RSP2_9BACT|nr:peptidase domain-containing ABC transporter [Chitinophaga varians]NLR68660.1 peptidase domain-containing ABC transporter [Chitinophaga varians]